MRTCYTLPFVLLMLASCSEKPAPDQEQSEQVESMEAEQDFDLQGHRGARGLYPENSVEGFLAAVDLQVNTLEMDVVISKDKKVVVSHEPWINSVICSDSSGNPIPDGKGLNMFEMSYDQISKYDCGSQPHPDFPLQAKLMTVKPLLSEVVTKIEASVASLELEPIKYNIEIKSTLEGDNIYHPEPAAFCQLVYDQIIESGIKERTIIQSFDVRSLQAMKKIDSSVPVALLIYETQAFENDLEKLGFTPEIYSPYYKLVDEDLVQSCKANNIELIPWTVNDEDDMIELLERGVDGIITDYPDVALTLKM